MPSRQHGLVVARLISSVLVAWIVMMSGSSLQFVRADNSIEGSKASNDLAVNRRALLGKAIDGRPTSCEAVKRAQTPTPLDGNYNIVIAGQLIKVICIMGRPSDAVKTYLRLPAIATSQLPDVNVFTFAGGVVKTAYKAVRLNTAADGSYFIDTTDKRFADTAIRKFDPKQDGTISKYNSVLQLGTQNDFISVNYATAATCSTAAPGQGFVDLTGTPFSMSSSTFGASNPGVHFLQRGQKVVLTATSPKSGTCKLISPQPNAKRLPLSTLLKPPCGVTGGGSGIALLQANKEDVFWDIAVADPVNLTYDGLPPSVTGTVATCLGNGDGTFSGGSSFSVAVPNSGPVGVAALDFNPDGLMDLIVGSLGVLAAYPAIGGGIFGNPTSSSVPGYSTQDVAITKDSSHLFMSNPQTSTFPDGTISALVSAWNITTTGSVIENPTFVPPGSPVSLSNFVVVLYGSAFPVLDAAQQQVFVAGGGPAGSVWRVGVDAMTGTLLKPHNNAVPPQPLQPSTDISIGGTPRGIAVASSNAVALAARAQGSVQVLNLAAGIPPSATLVPTEPSIPVVGAPERVIALDFNSDGTDDFAVLSLGTNTITFLSGNFLAGGPAVVSTVVNTCAAPAEMAAADFNSDGHVDVVVACSQAVFIHFGDGAGHFSAGRPI